MFKAAPVLHDGVFLWESWWNDWKRRANRRWWTSWWRGTFRLKNIKHVFQYSQFRSIDDLVSVVYISHRIIGKTRKWEFK